MRELQLLPAPVVSDEVFLRRVYLDVIGALPTPEEARAAAHKGGEARQRLRHRAAGPNPSPGK